MLNILSNKEGKTMVEKEFTREQLAMLADCVLAKISQWAKVGEGVANVDLEQLKLRRIGELRTMLDYINDGREE